MTTHKEQFNSDLVEFVRQQPEEAAAARREASRETEARL
jgi:hypothetical protein